jgi:hypothetical protein
MRVGGVSDKRATTHLAARSRLRLAQIDQRDPQIGVHHLAQLGWRLGRDDLQRREHPAFEQVATARRGLYPAVRAAR